MDPTDSTDATATVPTTATTTTTAPAAPAGGGDPPGKSFTQEQLNAIVAQRLVEDRQRRGKEPAKPNGEAKPPAGHLSSEDVQRMLTRDRAFTRAATQAQLTDKQAERMEAAMRADNPDDPATWARGYLEDMGIAKPATLPNNGTAPSGAPPAAAPSAPSKVDVNTVNGGLVNVLELPPEQFAQLVQSGQLRPAWEKFIEAGHRQQGAPRPPKALTRK